MTTKDPKPTRKPRGNAAKLEARILFLEEQLAEADQIVSADHGDATVGAILCWTTVRHSDEADGYACRYFRDACPSCSRLAET